VNGAEKIQVVLILVCVLLQQKLAVNESSHQRSTVLNADLTYIRLK